MSEQPAVSDRPTNITYIQPGNGPKNTSLYVDQTCMKISTAISPHPWVDSSEKRMLTVYVNGDITYVYSICDDISIYQYYKGGILSGTYTEFKPDGCPCYYADMITGLLVDQKIVDAKGYDESRYIDQCVNKKHFIHTFYDMLDAHEKERFNNVIVQGCQIRTFPSIAELMAVNPNADEIYFEVYAKCCEIPICDISSHDEIKDEATDYVIVEPVVEPVTLRLNYSQACKCVAFFKDQDDVDEWVSQFDNIASPTREDMHGKTLFQALINNFELLVSLFVSPPCELDAINRSYMMAIGELLDRKCYIDMCYLRTTLPRLAKSSQDMVRTCFREHYNIDIL